MVMNGANLMRHPADDHKFAVFGYIYEVASVFVFIEVNVLLPVVVFKQVITQQLLHLLSIHGALSGQNTIDFTESFLNWFHTHLQL